MKLELKHLTPYLPYGLKIRNQAFRIDYVNKEFGVLNGIYPLYKDEKCYWQYTTSENSTGSSLKNCKPILRPLSDLTKEYDLDNSYEGWQSEWIEHLLSKHFDVFGLIEKGLAIDINTI